jgi:hypothetical protein
MQCLEEMSLSTRLNGKPLREQTHVNDAIILKNEVTLFQSSATRLIFAVNGSKNILFGVHKYIENSRQVSFITTLHRSEYHV